jgi:3-oxoacyl-[acyl-carrier-protein] synthase II
MQSTMQNGRRRVVVTGLGALSPLGNDVETTWAGLVAGRSGVGPITRFDATGFESTFAGEVKAFDADALFGRKEAKRMDRFVQFALAASRQAMASARLDVAATDPLRVGVVIGTGIGGIETFEAQHQALREKGPGRVSPFFIPMMIANMASGQVSIALGAKGPSFTTVSACSSGAHAIGEAMRLVQHGDVDAVLAGGAEATITPMAVAGFLALKALSTRNDDPQAASRPFDRDRDGFVMGEGAGVLVLESEEHARRRGATVLCELAGYGTTADAYHITAPSEDGEGAARAMRAALLDAGIELHHVHYINAHGTSTPAGDPVEVRAVKDVFGEHAKRLMMSSTKSMTGHLLGAAGGLEAVITALVLGRGVVPPTINLEHQDDACDLDLVPNQARKATVKVALSNSFGFGGHNVTLAMKAVD